METNHLKSLNCDEDDEAGRTDSDAWRQAERQAKDAETEAEERKRGRMLWLFVLNMGCLCMSFLMLVIYNNVVLRTLERRFGLSSFQTGILSSSNDIMQICLVVFLAYFGNKGHRPRIISCTVMFASLSGFLMASPHFLFHDYENRHVIKTINVFPPNYNLSLLPPTKAPILSSNTTKPAYSPPFCLATNDHISQCSSSQSDSSLLNIHPAFYVFLVAQFISGVGASALYTLSMAYIDENAPKNKLSLYLACFMCFFSLSPIMGMLLAGVCLKLPENLLSGDRANINDTTFVGCWWLGYVIASTLITLFAIPLSLFPASLKQDIKSSGTVPLKDGVVEESVVTSFKEQAKEFPRALVKLVSNKLYILNLCQIICGAYTIYGMYVNLVRYIETHFLYPATIATIVAGVSSSAIAAIGSLSGGILVSKLNMDTKRTMKLIVYSGAVYVVGVAVLVNIQCPQVQMDMTYTGDPYQSTVENSCTEACNCELDRKSYSPVCGSNGISYYSPCLAGCSSQQNNTFMDCKCLRKLPSNDTIYDFRTAGKPLDFSEGTATAGYCTPKCKMFAVFTVVLVLMSFCTSITRVPGTMITFNIVDKDERSFALGFNSFILNLLGFIPSPLLFGRLIDKSCILWQWTCNKTGACLLFDTARLRYSIYGATLVVESIELCLFIAILFLIPRRALHSPHQIIETEVLETEVKVNSVVEMEERKDGGDSEAAMADSLKKKGEFKNGNSARL